MRILMVCLGNICRSPLAEGIMQAKIREHGLNWVVDSAGTSGWHDGERPDRRSVLAAKENGVDISGQRSRQFRKEDFNNFDLIFAMDTQNRKDILALASSKEEEAKVELILNLSFPGQDRSVPDPYYDSDGFGHVYKMLLAACEKTVERYK